jgi:hypothetical protein
MSPRANKRSASSHSPTIRFSCHELRQRETWLYQIAFAPKTGKRSVHCSEGGLIWILEIEALNRKRHEFTVFSLKNA